MGCAVAAHHSTRSSRWTTTTAWAAKATSVRTPSTPALPCRRASGWTTPCAPGAVTVMAIPKSDPLQPDAPRPDRLFLDAICRYLDRRRLVTTEVFLRGP